MFPRVFSLAHFVAGAASGAGHLNTPTFTESMLALTIMRALACSATTGLSCACSVRQQLPVGRCVTCT